MLLDVIKNNEKYKNDVQDVLDLSNEISNKYSDKTKGEK